MRANFDASLALVLKHEGGYVNDPQDSGGATNRGVTQRVYDLWRVDHQLPKQSVKCITPAEVFAIYRKQYWERVKGDELPSGLDYCLFDFAVNSGTDRAARYLQECLFVDVDGKIGPQTLAAIHPPIGNLIDGICDMRQRFLERQPNFGHFGKGWTQRVKDVRARAKEMAA